MTSRGQRGQGSTEFVGIVAVAVLLVGSVVYTLSEASNDVRASVERGICEIVSMGQGDCGDRSGDVSARAVHPDAEIPTYQDPALSPEARATQGNYVALGDSFSSGEGGSEYEDGTDVDMESLEQSYFENKDKPTSPRYQHSYRGPDPYSNQCHRSTNAYGQQVAETYGFGDGRFTFRACSGAVINDFTVAEDESDPEQPWKGNDDEPAQRDHVDANTSLITFSVGGNDARFADTLSGCIGAGLNPFDSCSDDDEREKTRADIDAVGPRLTELLGQMREKAPNARIIVVGYPRFFAHDPDTVFDGTQIDKGDQAWINDATEHMNDVMAQAIEDAGGAYDGFEFVNVYDAFEGCEIGTDDPCMNNLDNDIGNGKLVSNGSYHPNDRGHDKLAAMVEEQVRNGG